MPEHNAENERIKRRYFAYLKEADRRSEATVDAVAAARPGLRPTPATGTFGPFATNRQLHSSGGWRTRRRSDPARS